MEEPVKLRDVHDPENLYLNGPAELEPVVPDPNDPRLIDPWDDIPPDVEIGKSVKSARACDNPWDWEDQFYPPEEENEDE